MSGLKKGLVASALLLIAIPFGIIFMLVIFAIINNAKTTGYVYLKGIFDFVLLFVAMNFFLPLFMGLVLIFVNNISRIGMNVLTGLSFVLLVLDIEPLRNLISDLQSGVRIGIPWTFVLLCVHVFLALTLYQSTRAMFPANSEAVAREPGGTV